MRAGVLSDEDRVSVADHVLETNGYPGRQFHIPTATYANAEPLGLDPRLLQRRYSAEAEEFVNAVLRSRGYVYQIRVEPQHWDLRQQGSGQACTDRANYIGISGNHTDALTLLHEIAHILTKGGHGHEFQLTAHELYSEHLGAEAARLFASIVWPEYNVTNNEDLS